MSFMQGCKNILNFLTTELPDYQFFLEFCLEFEMKRKENFNMNAICYGILKHKCLNPISHGIFKCQVPRGAPPIENPLEIFISNFSAQLSSCIIVSLMQKDTGSSSKLRKLRNFEILVGNWGKKSGRKEIS